MSLGLKLLLTSLVSGIASACLVSAFDNYLSTIGEIIEGFGLIISLLSTIVFLVSIFILIWN